MVIRTKKNMMLKNKSFHRLFCLALLFAGLPEYFLFAQPVHIDFEEALNIARINYIPLERDLLKIEQMDHLADVGILPQPTQLFLTGEEFDFEGQTGIQSLNVQQVLYLPKANKTQKAYYQQGGEVAQKQYELTDQLLVRSLKQAYLQLQYQTQELELIEAQIELFNNFLTITTMQLENGETGRLPQLAAQNRLGQALLQKERVTGNYQLALLKFNQWLGSDSLRYLPKDTLSGIEVVVPQSFASNHPSLQVLQAKQALAVANVEVQEAKLLPQINAGLRLQNAFGVFPLFGYQLGINVPIIRKPYKTRIEAAQLGVQIQQSEWAAAAQTNQRTVQSLQTQMQQQLSMLQYLEQTLFPLLKTQSQINEQAYAEGMIGYLEYLDVLEQIVDAKRQRLALLYQCNVLQAELDYWLGN